MRGVLRLLPFVPAAAAFVPFSSIRSHSPTIPTTSAAPQDLRSESSRRGGPPFRSIDDDDADFDLRSEAGSGVHLRDLNPSQTDAVTQPTHSITRVVAGPGAGKTRVLTCRIAHLLRTDPSRSSRILAVTFTKKAAGEMSRRLEELLVEQRQQEEDGAANVDDGVMFPAVTHGGGGDSDIVQEEAPDGPSSPGRRSRPPLLDRVTLGTFHSVCAKILRWNGRELSSLPSIVRDGRKLSVVSADGSAENRDDETSSVGAAADASAALLDGSFAIIDQGDQLRIVKECLKEAGIELKGAGGGGAGGKADIRPITILNAVSQLKSDEAVGAVNGNGGDGTKLGIGGDDDAAQQAGGRKMSDKVRRIAETVYPMYRRRLLSHNSLDFDDLILLTRELLASRPDIRENLQRRWGHLLVDEFQDTSRAQLDLVKLLTTRSLFVVGDGDQSIYSWRGAHSGSMSGFVEEFDGHHDGGRGVGGEDADDKHGSADGGKDAAKVNTVYLMENYRSTTNIVRAAQKIISFDESLNQPNSAQSAVRQDMKPMRGKGPTPRVLACSNSKAEASFVVKTILKMVQDGALTPESTIAIIYRTNAQSRALEEECVAQNLRYLLRGSAGAFYSRAEVKDCLCFLRCLYNGRDRSSMLRAFKTPSRGIGEVAMNEFFAYCDEVDSFLSSHYPDRPRSTPLDILISLTDTSVGNVEGKCPLPGDFMSKRAFNRFLPFASQMKAIREAASTKTVSGLLSGIIESLNLRDHFDSISKTSAEFSDRMGNVMELCSAAERYNDDGPCMLPVTEAEGVSPLGQFLDDVALLTETNDDDDDNSSKTKGAKRVVANLMTIHASKGMEFDAVFLVGNEEGTFPTQRSISEGEGSVELDEERRLCYVAMTRAKTHLVLTWRREVMSFFGQAFRVIDSDRSRFLDALVVSKSKRAPSKKDKEGKWGVEGRSSSVRKSSSKQLRQESPPWKQAVVNADGSRAVSRSATRNGRRDLPKSPQGGPWKEWKPASVSRTDRPSTSTMRKQQGARYQERRPPRTSPARQRREREVLSRQRRPGTQIAVPASEANSMSRGESPKVDSTLFYPVGTSVVHAVHGGGKVLPPPHDADDGDVLVVRVEFDNGIEVDFPVGDSSLRIKF